MNKVCILNILDVLKIQYVHVKGTMYYMGDKSGKILDDYIVLSSGEYNCVEDLLGGRPEGKPYDFIKSYMGLTDINIPKWFRDNDLA